jgi:hypothetical protein
MLTMDNSVAANAEIEPILIQRACGGWLGIAPLDARFRIAVTAATPDEAIQKFLSVYKRWTALLELDVPK